MASPTGLAKDLALYSGPLPLRRQQGSARRPSDKRIAPPVSSLRDYGIPELAQIEVSLAAQERTLWAYMRPNGRPCQNPEMLADFRRLQDGIERNFGAGGLNIDYFVFGSRFPGVFSLGGDLQLFASKIRTGDEAALVDYGNSCVDVLHRNMNALDLPIITIGLVQGDALGGGFEGLLSFDVIIAEKGTKFGFPEILFGLFPGMGAYSFLARRLGTIKAQELILDGRTYTAEEMHELGIVHILAERGQGEAAVRSYIASNHRRRNGQQAIYRAAREVNRISLDELRNIVSVWAAAAMNLTDRDLNIMERLVVAQDKLRDKARRAESAKPRHSTD
ncbi:enoyl-CoA hydratase [Methylorubrum extorquens]|uniref:crotonase/enoyl-CoA hydratase family protein n=1 Tax=Methylorubrum extorquens TaxID=408 RepID=UPI0011709DA5|nr:crotonase/enoyl-CoA hydratase family protein [Methylorubrum extorquens]GEL44754.1 enoyl-CoA hydratase [Methylorubrum extorquens]